MEREIFVCSCGSLEHQVSFWWDEEAKTLYCEPHLVTHNSFFKRMWVAIKYVFGYTSRFGTWDSTIFEQDDLVKLNAFLRGYDRYSEKLSEVPADAHSIEVFSIKENRDSPSGKEAFIGFKISNGNFHFIGAPYTGE